MKNTNLSTKFMMAAILLTVLVYFGANLISYFVDPFSTTIAYSYTGEDAVTVSGYVVREEMPITADGDTVSFIRSEGERVSKGGKIALMYSNAQALHDANELRALEEQMEQLLYAQSLVGTIQSTGALDREVSAALTAFQAERALGSLSAASDAGAAVRAAILRYSYAYTGTDELSHTIAALQNEIDALTASISGATTTVRAPKSGLFSSLVDGYESVLTPERLADMTAEDYRGIAPAQPEGVCKLIYGTKWYFVTLLRAADAKELTAGEKVTLRFQTGLERDLSLRVERIGDEDGGQRLVVLSSREDLSLTTLLRHQSAQIIFARYDGIRVPRSAVRILWETVTDDEGNPVLNADGTEKQRQVYGVYCMWGNTARFKKVNILWQEDDYMIVESVNADDPLRRLRAGDQVITAAEDLYDGKVIE